MRNVQAPPIYEVGSSRRNNNTVTLDRTVNVASALGIAANVCDLSVGVLAQQLQSGSATCTNTLDGVTATLNQP